MEHLRLIIIHIISFFIIGIAPGYSQIKFQFDDYEKLYIELPTNDSIGAFFTNHSLKLDNSDWNQMELNIIEKFNSTYDYSIIAAFKIDELKFIIVQRKYAEENVHWLCMINNSDKLKDWLMTAYDNSEGFLTIRSLITYSNIITIERNEFSDKKMVEVSYLITEQGFLK